MTIITSIAKRKLFWFIVREESRETHKRHRTEKKKPTKQQQQKKTDGEREAGLLSFCPKLCLQYSTKGSLRFLVYTDSPQGRTSPSQAGQSLQ